MLAWNHNVWLIIRNWSILVLVHHILTLWRYVAVSLFYILSGMNRGVVYYILLIAHVSLSWIGWPVIELGRWRKGLQIHDLSLIRSQRSHDLTALAPLFRVECQHSTDNLEQEMTVLILENIEQPVQVILLKLIRISGVERVTVLEGATREDNQSYAENFSKTGIYMRGISSFLDHVIVYLFRGQIYYLILIMDVFHKTVIAVELSRQRA